MAPARCPGGDEDQHNTDGKEQAARHPADAPGITTHLAKGGQHPDQDQQRGQACQSEEADAPVDGANRHCHRHQA
jgi:hypothetical protein